MNIDAVPKMIELAQELVGVKYWAQHVPYAPPGAKKLEVFKYVGKDSTVGLYYFKHVKRGHLVSRGINQLNVNGFFPFVLDTKRLEALYEESKKHEDI